MVHVFVSGCYDLLHAGHLAFFADARALGDKLTVCFASDEVLLRHKGCRSALPEAHKRMLLKSLRMVDDVVIGRGPLLGLDFIDHFRQLRPSILAVTEDDQFAEVKRTLCAEVGAEYRQLPKRGPCDVSVSTTDIRRRMRVPRSVPLRVDFAGGWLDVPRLARDGAYVVNCAISPLVSLDDWPFAKQSGLGGSAAWSILQGESAMESEFRLGAGWQDPAVIAETGLCVWQSGTRPTLRWKSAGLMLAGCLALHNTGVSHMTSNLVDMPRDYQRIADASQLACRAVLNESVSELAAAMMLSYESQLAEGMSPLPRVSRALAQKYCGSGWGGYGVYIFRCPEDRRLARVEEPSLVDIEPYMTIRAMP